MPADNIKRAIDRGLGKDGADSFEELTYEVYGPGGVAIIVETATDNRNRTIGEMRHILSKYGGNLGESGSVSWMFEKKGIITIDKKTVDEDKLLMVTLEAGADDLRTDDPDEYEVVTSPASFENVRNVLEQQGIAVNDAKLSLLPANVVHISGEESERLLKLLEAIEDNDDVQNVYTNADWD
jgi:YebC/PmpR family DNA-binding regulatory protein